MNIATALNRKYLLYTGVMLESLCQNNPEHIDAYLLHTELKDEDIKLLQDALQQYDINIISLKVNKDAFDDRLPRNVQWSIEAYFRLMLLDLLPPSVDRLMYLDVDLIINKDILEFYHVDFAGDEIIATHDSSGMRNLDTMGKKQREMFTPMCQMGYLYFNSGVMLLNIAAMRGKYSFATYLKAIEEWNYQMEAPDQDILNYVHWQKVGYVDYNEFDMFARIAHNRGISYDGAKEIISIIHFAGDKPWDVTNCHFDIEKIWWDYAKCTPFYHELLEDFVGRTMIDTTMENTVAGLINENGALKSKVEELTAISNKLLDMMGKMK